MTNNDITRMAREAGIDDWWDSGSEWRETFNAHIERFAALVAAAEREACAKVCDIKAEVMAITGKSCDPDDLAAAIRARGETK